MLPAEHNPPRRARPRSHGPPTVAWLDGSHDRPDAVSRSCAAATRRLIRTVDGHWPTTAYADPSLLPGLDPRPTWSPTWRSTPRAWPARCAAWSRASRVPMYASAGGPRRRHRRRSAAAAPEAIRDRLLGATTDFADALAAVPEDAWDATIERTPAAGPSRPATSSACGCARSRSTTPTSDAGYPHADWPPAFAVRLLDAMAQARPPDAVPVHATDLDRTWHARRRRPDRVAGPPPTSAGG